MIFVAVDRKNYLNEIGREYKNALEILLTSVACIIYLYGR
jgi:hypothetical protein